jgi:hypothetical protein
MTGVSLHLADFIVLYARCLEKPENGYSVALTIDKDDTAKWYEELFRPCASLMLLEWPVRKAPPVMAEVWTTEGFLEAIEYNEIAQDVVMAATKYLTVEFNKPGGKLYIEGGL